MFGKVETYDSTTMQGTYNQCLDNAYNSNHSCYLKCGINDDTCNQKCNAVVDKEYLKCDLAYGKRK